MDNFDYKKESDFEGGREVFSKVVKAGKRTYFFDVKAMRNDSLYVTITESRKKRTREGEVIYDKHKMHLYQEDFSKFAEGLEEVFAYVRTNEPNGPSPFVREEKPASMSVDEEFDSL